MNSSNFRNFRAGLITLSLIAGGTLAWPAAAAFPFTGVQTQAAIDVELSAAKQQFEALSKRTTAMMAQTVARAEAKMKSLKKQHASDSAITAVYNQALSQLTSNARSSNPPLNRLEGTYLIRLRRLGSSPEDVNTMFGYGDDVVDEISTALAVAQDDLAEALAGVLGTN